MVEREEGRKQGAGVLRRWSRRKQEITGPGEDSAAAEDAHTTLEDEPDPALANQTALAAPELSSPGLSSTETNPQNVAEATPEDPAEPLLSDEDMPAIESISKDSDVSCFFNRGVSEQLRQRALRHLLRLPAFNITDGLNDYDEDYTSFEPLGDIVTSDMRFQARRKEKLAAQKREEEEALASQEAEALEAEEVDSAQNTETTESAEDTPEVDELNALAAESAGHVIDSTPLDAETESAAAEQAACVRDNNNPGDLA